jgi:ketosteroid isomerase-like protein
VRTELPAPIAAFVQAMNAHDTKALVACFTDDALVHDEGRDHRGGAAIREWSDGVIAKYQVRLDVLAVAARAGETLVTVQVAGTFPGSPIQLGYAFKLRDGKIATLRIG